VAKSHRLYFQVCKKEKVSLYARTVYILPLFITEATKFTKVSIRLLVRHDSVSDYTKIILEKCIEQEIELNLYTN
jgi:hypothetical protein